MFRSSLEVGNAASTIGMPTRHKGGELLCHLCELEIIGKFDSKCMSSITIASLETDRTLVTAMRIVHLDLTNMNVCGIYEKETV